MQDKIFTSKVFVDEEMKKAVNEVFDSGIFVMGQKLKEFERKFADFIGTKYAVAISNGTTAIEVTLQAIGIGSGDEVIVPSHTAFPTIEPILQLGAKPVFVDIDEKTYTISPAKINEAITSKTKAVIPVHIYGQAADLGPIQELCKRHSIFLIEDCCQAHNAKYMGQQVGSFGVAGCFSFYPSKNITVCGDGGMIVTNDREIDRKVRMLLNHGQDGTYNHVVLGHNYRLSEIHCAIGSKQLEKVGYFTKRRQEIAARYHKMLSGLDIILPKEAEYGEHVYHLYVVRVNAGKRDNIISMMKNIGIFCGIHYPIACHQQKAVLNMPDFQAAKPPRLPVTEKIVKEIISLPIYPLLTDDEVDYICSRLKECL